MCSQLPRDSPQEWGIWSASENGIERVPRSASCSADLAQSDHSKRSDSSNSVVWVVRHFSFDPYMRFTRPVVRKDRRKIWLLPQRTANQQRSLPPSMSAAETASASAAVTFSWTEDGTPSTSDALVATDGRIDCLRHHLVLCRIHMFDLSCERHKQFERPIDHL